MGNRIDHIYWLFRHGIWNWVEERPRAIRTFIQRGKRGWAVSDTWGFDYYLTDVILGGLKHLRKNKCGYPVTVYKEGQDPNDIDDKANSEAWDKILDSMIYSFEVADKILNGDPDWYYIPSSEFTVEEYNKRKEQFKSCLYVMTLEEVQKYEDGWKNFQKYYFNLWD